MSERVSDEITSKGTPAPMPSKVCAEKNNDVGQSQPFTFIYTKDPPNIVDR